MAKELHISPAEVYQMPISMVQDLFLLFTIQKEQESKEMDKVKNSGRR